MGPLLLELVLVLLDGIPQMCQLHRSVWCHLQTCWALSPTISMMKIWHLSFIPLMTAQCFNLSRLLGKDPCSPRESTEPPCFTSSANLQMGHSIRASRSLRGILRGTPLGTCHQPDVAKFTATFCILLFTTSSSQSWTFAQMDARGTAPKPSQKSGNYICHLTFTWQADDIIVKEYQTSETGMYNKEKVTQLDVQYTKNYSV